MKTVNEVCPKDCRFAKRISHGSKMRFCDYGAVAHQEGKIKGYARGGTVEECTVYEPSDGNSKMKMWRMV